MNKLFFISILVIISFINIINNNINGTYKLRHWDYSMKNYIKNYLNINKMGDFTKDYENPVILKDVYNLFKYQIINESNSNSYYNNLIGIYYSIIDKNFDMAEKHYKIAIKNNFTAAMYNLAVSLEKLEKLEKYDEIIKYYEMAVINNRTNAMFRLGNYYMKHSNYKNMLKYYMMAANNNHTISMYNLGVYYYNNHEYTMMKIFFNKAVNNGSPYAMCALNMYYNHIEHNKSEAQIYYKLYNKLDLAKYDKNIIIVECNNYFYNIYYRDL